MHFRQLRTFLSVATTLSFTKSAAQLHLAQSSVTEQIQSLESDLGVQLFDRAQRKLALTAAGQRLVEHAKQILALTNEARAAVAEAANAAVGELAVGGLDTLCAEWLPAILSRYETQCPDVQVLLRTGNSAELRHGLMEGTLDVRFSFSSASTDTELSSIEVGREPLVIILPMDHPLSRQRSLTAEDFLDEKFLVTQSGCIYRRMFDDAFATSHPHRPRIVGELAGLSAVCAMVQAGVGCAIVPRLAASRALEDGLVAAVPWIGAEATVPITVSWNRRQSARPALKRFIDTARERFADLRRDADLHPRASLSPS
jgi:DNA-binding transcriptional LysR family regulator